MKGRTRVVLLSNKHSFGSGQTGATRRHTVMLNSLFICSAWLLGLEPRTFHMQANALLPNHTQDSALTPVLHNWASPSNYTFRISKVLSVRHTWRMTDIMKNDRHNLVSRQIVSFQWLFDVTFAHQSLVPQVRGPQFGILVTVGYVDSITPEQHKLA